jgi:hypothetical protein
LTRRHPEGRFPGLVEHHLHTQDKSCWTHELQLTPFATKPSF